MYSTYVQYVQYRQGVRKCPNKKEEKSHKNEAEETRKKKKKNQKNKKNKNKKNKNKKIAPSEWACLRPRLFSAAQKQNAKVTDRVPLRPQRCVCNIPTMRFPLIRKNRSKRGLNSP